MAKVNVGLVGCGFVAELHMYAYKRVYGVDARVKAVAARGDNVVEFAKKHGIAQTYRSFRGLIADKDIDIGIDSRPQSRLSWAQQPLPLPTYGRLERPGHLPRLQTIALLLSIFPEAISGNIIY